MMAARAARGRPGTGAEFRAGTHSMHRSSSMSRLPATIVIPVWNQWELTRACLESLRPTLGVRDEVVIVDNGSEDGTAEGLRQFSWARVITNEVNRGFAVACNQGAAVARRPI